MKTKLRRLDSNCKKANIFFDVTLFILVLFVFGLVAIFSTKLLHGFNTSIQQTSTLGNQSSVYLNNVDGYMGGFFDNLFVFFLVLLWVATIIFSFLIDNHPVFFIIALFLLIITVFIGFLMGNVFNDITTNTDLTDDISSFTLTTWVFNNMGLVTLIVGASVIIALYVKNTFSGGGGGL